MIEGVVCNGGADFVGLRKTREIGSKDGRRLPTAPNLSTPCDENSVAAPVENDTDTLSAVRRSVAYPSQHAHKRKAHVLKGADTTMRKAATGKNKYRPARFKNAEPFGRPELNTYRSIALGISRSASDHPLMGFPRFIDIAAAFLSEPDSSPNMLSLYCHAARLNLRHQSRKECH